MPKVSIVTASCGKNVSHTIHLFGTKPFYEKMNRSLALFQRGIIDTIEVRRQTENYVIYNLDGTRTRVKDRKRVLEEKKHVE